MASYKEIKGLTVQALSAEPTLTTGREGQVWYNSGTGLGGGRLRILGAMDAWSSNTVCNTGRRLRTGFGTQDAGTMAFGYGPAAPVFNCEEFNGSSWAIGGTSPTPLTANDEGTDQVGTTGSSGLSAGGYRNAPAATIANTNEYDGTTWTGGGALPGARAGGLTGFGSVAAGVTTGGHPSVTACDEYASSTWTNVNASLTGRGYGAGCGTQSTGLNVGGTPFNTAVEEYDATSWSAGTALPTGTQKMGAAGNSGSAISFFGNTSGSVGVLTSQTYDGSAWTAGASGAIAGYAGAHFGTSTAAVWAAGIEDGNPAGSPTGGGYTNQCQIYNNDYYYRLPGVWVSQSNPANGRQWASGAGTADAGIMFGGLPRVSPTPTCEEFDGSVWAAGGAYNAADKTHNGGGAGTQTATLGWAGVAPAPTGTNITTNTYNGTAWALSPAALGNARYQFSCAGTETAAVMMGGRGAAPSRNIVDTEEFNGSSWASSGNLNTGTETGAGGPQGSQTDAVIFGGIYPTATSQTETYNGAVWASSGATLIEAGHGQAAAGTSASPMLAAGSAPNPGAPYALTTCQEFDGSSWGTAALLATATAGSAGFGTPTTLITAGGRDASANALAQTQEFSGASSTLAASSMTTS